MTDEPIYNYIPGQGWVPGGEASGVTINVSGRSVTILNRQPEVGEQCGMFHYRDLTYLNAAGEVDIVAFAAHMLKYGVNPKVYGRFTRKDESYRYCTIIVE